jgi:hypothetical protein
MCELWIYRWWTHIPEWRYARQYFWVRLANNMGSKSFKKSKLNWTHLLTKLNTNKSCYVKKYLALVGMCMSLRNLSIFIQLRSISKSRFSKIMRSSYEELSRQARRPCDPQNLGTLSIKLHLGTTLRMGALQVESPNCGVCSNFHW